MTQAATVGRTPSSRERTGGFIHFIGLFWFVVFEILHLVQNGTDGLPEASLQNAVVCLIGINGIVAASGHLFFPQPVAASIGWAEGGPLQWEVGMAKLGRGVTGMISPAR